MANALAIPANAALIGRVFHHQVVPIEWDRVGNITARTSTNALQLTSGSFE